MKFRLSFLQLQKMFKIILDEKGGDILFFLSLWHSRDSYKASFITCIISYIIPLILHFTKSYNPWYGFNWPFQIVKEVSNTGFSPSISILKIMLWKAKTNCSHQLLLNEQSSIKLKSLSYG